MSPESHQDTSSSAFHCSCESESRSVLSDSLRAHGPYSPWDSPSQDTGVGSRSLLQGIIPTQGSNSGLPHCRWILYQMSHQGNPCSLMSPIKSLILQMEVLDYFLNGLGPVDVSDTALPSWRVKTTTSAASPTSSPTLFENFQNETLKSDSPTALS